MSRDLLYIMNRTSFKIVALGLFLIFLAPLALSQKRRSSAKANDTTTEQQEISLLSEAAGLLQAGKLDEAEPLVRRVLAIAPSNADAHNLLGVILDQRGQSKAAEQEYLKALRLNPRAVSACANLGVLLARTGRSDEAARIFEDLLGRVPNHPEATLNLGLLYVAHGDFARAVPLLQSARSYQPNNVAVLTQLGIALYHLQQIDEASKVLVAAAALGAPNADLNYALGLIASAKDEGATAVSYWQKALLQRENFGAATFMIGEELRKRKAYDGAVEYYQRAIEQDPAQLVYYVRLGGTFMLLLRYDLALDIFRLAAQRFPKSAEAQYFVGIAARGNGNFDIAEAALRKSLALKENNVDALAQLGFVIGESEHNAEAEEILRRAIATDPRHFYATYNLGRLLVRAKRFDEAIAILGKAAQLRPRDASVHYQLFLAYSRLKRTEDASRELAAFKQYDLESRNHPQGDEEIEDTLPKPASEKP